jgi:hypothetical protein
MPGLVACLACASLVLAAAPAGAASFAFEVGLRAGYVFGRGWTFGPDVGFLAAESDPAGSNHFLGGIDLAGDVLVSSAGDASFRLRLGPQVMALHACPAIGPKLAGGATAIFHRGAAPRLGFEGGVSLFAMVTQRTTFNQVFSDQWFLAAGYRYTELLDGDRTHELELGGTIWAAPGPNQRIATFGLCNAFGHLDSGGQN